MGTRGPDPSRADPPTAVQPPGRLGVYLKVRSELAVCRLSHRAIRSPHLSVDSACPSCPLLKSTPNHSCAELAEPSGLQLIGNGDVMSFEDWNAHLGLGADGGAAPGGGALSTCMIGRGALVKPWVFTEIKVSREAIKKFPPLIFA